MRTITKAAVAVTTALIAIAGAGPAAAASVDTVTATSRGGYVATIRTNSGAEDGETFQVRLVDRADISAAFAVLHGESNDHVNGRIVRTPSRYNPGYGWHLDPNDVAFAHLSIELCDGQPSFVGEDWWTSERFCPWHGKVVDMQPVRY